MLEMHEDFICIKTLKAKTNWSNLVLASRKKLLISELCVLESIIRVYENYNIELASVPFSRFMKLFGAVS